MATALDNSDDSDVNQAGQGSLTGQQQSNQQAQPQSAAPAVGGLTGGSIATPGGSGVGSSGAKVATPTSSGSFNNLQKYLNANQDFNAQGGGLAGTITGNINNQANQAQNNLNATQQAFNQQNSNATNQFGNASVVNSALADPTQFVSNPANVQAFNNEINSTYNGPTSLSNVQGANNFNELQSQANNVNSLAGETQTEAGRYNLLKQMFNNNNYTSGEQNLDNIMLQNNPGQLGQFQQARTAASNLNQNLNNAQNTATQTAANSQQAAAANAANVQNLTNQAVANQYQNMQNAYTAAQNAVPGQLQTAVNNLNAGALSPDDMTVLTAAGYIAGSPTYNFQNALKQNTPDLSTLFTNNTASWTPQTAASAQDTARMMALGQLLGNNANAASATDIGTYNNPALAGTALPAIQLSQVGAQDINQAIGAQQNAYLFGNPNLASKPGVNPNLYNGANAINADIAKNDAVIASLAGAGGNPAAAAAPYEGNVASDMQQLAQLNYLYGLANNVNYGNIDFANPQNTVLPTQAQTIATVAPGQTVTTAPPPTSLASAFPNLRSKTGLAGRS